MMAQRTVSDMIYDYLNSDETFIWFGGNQRYKVVAVRGNRVLIENHVFMQITSDNKEAR